MTQRTIRSAVALRPPDTHLRPASRRAGAVVAFAIASLAAAIPAVIGMGPLLFVGVPVATVMGSLVAPTIRPDGTNLGRAALKLSVSTVLVGDAVVVVGLIVGNLPGLGSIGESPATLVAGSVYFWFAGLLVYGLPALAFVTGPCAVVWVMLMARLSLRPTDNEA